jgi:hypothetical protein
LEITCGVREYWRILGLCQVCFQWVRLRSIAIFVECFW